MHAAMSGLKPRILHRASTAHINSLGNIQREATEHEPARDKHVCDVRRQGHRTHRTQRVGKNIRPTHLAQQAAQADHRDGKSDTCQQITEHSSVRLEAMHQQ